MGNFSFLFSQNSILPEFPPRKIFGNVSDDFLDERIKKLQEYFQKLMKCYLINQNLNSGVFREFLQKILGKNIEKEKFSNVPNLKSWETLLNSIGEKIKNLKEFFDLIYQEFEKLELKVEEINHDVKKLNKNDTLTLIQLEKDFVNSN